jgi:Ca-activated chloride channel homolog
MQLEGINPYSVLGVAPTAAFDEIKAAYRRAARRLHPDSNRNNPGAAAQFQQITSAYEILIDDERRRAYDKQAAKRADEDPMQFTFRVMPSKRRVTNLAEAQVIYMLAEIFPDARANSESYKRESRLNLCLVLDRSNSMNGPRLNQVKVAAHQIIDNLNDNDILSLVVFNDRAEVIIPATSVTDRAALKARVSMMSAFGGTEIYQGLHAGVEETRKFLAPKLVNHIILLTDGNTFGDSEQTLALAREAAEQGIAVSGMGLGQEWNDEFLDQIAKITGGTSSYINSANAVVRFLNNHVRNLSNLFADRMVLSVAPDPDVKLESVFKLMPSPQPLDISEGFIPLGNLPRNRNISVLMQFELPAKMPKGFRSVARMVAMGDVMAEQTYRYQTLSDLSLEVTDAQTQDNPPTAILDALGKLTLYKMQERAQQALDDGDVRQATRHLENLATRLTAMGETELAQHARTEAQQVAHTAMLTDRGKKTLKYQTRALLAPPSERDNELESKDSV